MANLENNEEDQYALLIEEFQKFCSENGLPQKSADELIHDPNLTSEQIEFIEKFIEKWDNIDLD